jgi:LysM repeat protein
MKNLWRALLGILIGAASLCLILGIFSLSMAEGGLTATRASTQASTESPTAPAVASTNTSTPQPIILTPTETNPAVLLPTVTGSLTPTLTPSATPNPLPSLTTCPSPLGWTTYTVKSGDTFEKVAARYHTSGAILQQANCLAPDGLLPGLVIVVPPLPTQTPVPCGPPNTWVTYLVMPGDTLYHISQLYGVTVGELQRANCMGTSTRLTTGQILYVPPWPPFILSPTPWVYTFTPIPTETQTIVPPSDTPVESPTDTPVVVPTDTPLPSDTPPPTDVPTEIPTDTLIPTP